ncbi:DUF805 domain-containing protein [Enterococcus gilvus]|uniref:DUF805 domain-containing protein n=1 Tax=Enterococcus gilvus TaxID=160453 RepID=UPI003D6A756A
MKKVLEEGKVSFSQAVKDFFKGYADFRGRSTRAGYWWAVLAIAILYVVLAIITIVSSSNREYYESPINGFMLFLIGIFSLVILLPSWALAVRRLRDVGLKSKTILVLYIVYCAVYGTWMMSLYSSAVNSLSTITSLSNGFSDPSISSSGMSISGSPVALFIFMLLSAFIIISSFLPTNMLATTSKNKILTTIFSEK